METKEIKEKYCPKCHTAFTCNAADITNCQCYNVPLTDKTTSFLSKTFYDCLCKNCLAKINQDVAVAEDLQFPARPDMLVENLHYYKENGFWVFTELYHMLRGSCCGNGCRHCVYGFK